ncbi:hypothetical protein HYZ82_01655 [Candidatus Nomurabacteria bacterium]|nr:hypothetical protein [Candidatus Nomurabacteria bacterium]
MENKIKRKINNQAGAAMLISVIFFLFISLAIISGLAIPSIRDFRSANMNLNSKQSYFLAESGSEDAIYRIKNGMAIGTNETITLDLNEATTTITDVDTSTKQIISLGDVSSYERKTNITLSAGVGISFHYGIQVGQGGFQLSNNAGVNGNVYSNSDISGSNGSFITGDAFAVGTVSGVNVGGQTQTGVSSEDFPISDDQITTWKDEAAAEGTIGSQTLSGTGNFLGPKKIQGNLTLSNSAELTVNGTLWITGNLTLSNNSIVRLAPQYGSGDSIIIVDGVSTLSNGSDFYGSGAAESYVILLSTSSSGSAVVLSNNATAVILYAPNGTIQLGNSAQVKQITARTISLSNNAIINYEQGLISAAFSSGPSGGWVIDSWGESE